MLAERLTHGYGIAGLCAALLLATPAAAQQQGAARESPADLVNDLHAIFGQHHVRAVHAKGIVLDGSFTPTADARALSRAALFTAASVPVAVRFSDFTGLPDIPDTVDGASPRGMAVKFRMADGSVMDIVAHGFNGFPSATADEFGELLRAIAASNAGVAKPTPLERYFASHPAAKTFLTTQKPAPVSYATLQYYGVNSFRFVDAANGGSFVRYRMAPQAGEQFLDRVVLKTKGPDYLRQEIAARLAAGPVRFDWLAQIAATGDVIDNPSIAWPQDRRLVRLGTIEITRVNSDQAAADKALMFLPGIVPPGIETADPMIEVRNAAYPISFRERQ